MPNPIPPPPPPPSGGTRRAAIPPPTAGARAPAVHPGGLALEAHVSVIGLKANGLLCAVCKGPQYVSQSGPVCERGHGGADGVAPSKEPRPLNFSDLPVGFEPRDGDVLVVHYGAVKVPLPSGKFGSIEVGGESYTRQLRAGDDVGEQYEKVYGFLKGRAERAAQEKVKGWYSQFSKSEGGTT